MKKINLHNKNQSFNVDKYIKVEDGIFNELHESIKIKELRVYRNHKNMFNKIKKDDPKLYRKIYNSLSEDEKLWLDKGLLKKEYIQQVYKSSRASCDRIMRNKEPEDGTYTAISIMDNEINEKITIFQLETILNGKVIQNSNAPHSANHSEKTNSNPDYVLILPNNKEVLIELQTTFTSKDVDKFKFLNMKNAKLKNYKKQMNNNNKPVIHCEKVVNTKTNEVEFYFFDIPKLLEKGYLEINRDNVYELKKTGEYDHLINNFYNAGRRPRIYFENIQDCGEKRRLNEKLEITPYLKSFEKYLSKVEEKTETLTTTMRELFKNITLDEKLATAENKVQRKCITTRTKQQER